MKTLTPYEQLVQAVTDCLEYLEQARPAGVGRHVARLRRSLKISRIDSTMWSSLDDLSRDIKRSLSKGLDDEEEVEQRLLDVAEVALGALETLERAFDSMPKSSRLNDVLGSGTRAASGRIRPRSARTGGDGSLQCAHPEIEKQSECLLMGFARLPNMTGILESSDPLVGH